MKRVVAHDSAPPLYSLLQHAILSVWGGPAGLRALSALAGAAPHLLLLSATPHNGKGDAFHRLMALLDDRQFPSPSSVVRERVLPYVARTEKLRSRGRGRAATLPATPHQAGSSRLGWPPRSGGASLRGSDRVRSREL